jgi:hypothetical protein
MVPRQVYSHRSSKEVANLHNELDHIRRIPQHLLVYTYYLDLHMVSDLGYYHLHLLEHLFHLHHHLQLHSI